MRCDILYEELEDDAYGLLPYLDMLTPKNASASEHFTKHDVDAALSLYGDESLYRYTNNKIAFYSGIPKPEHQTRSGRRACFGSKTNRQIHAEKCSDMAKKSKENNAALNKGGRPSKKNVIYNYLNDHPEETNISKIARECDVDNKTARKYFREFIAKK